jgi:mono/diheme cytochrome c family protein
MKDSESRSVPRWTIAAPWVAAMTLVASGCAAPDGATSDRSAHELPVIELEEKPALGSHVEQKDIVGGSLSFDAVFDAGDRLFHAPFNGLDGVGAMLTAGGTPLNRFSIGPSGGGQPIAVSAQSCGDCHAVPYAAGAGRAQTRVTPDPDADGQAPFNARATTSLHGNGLLELLAQEMTEELLAARDGAVEKAKQDPGTPVEAALAARGVDFGRVVALADASGDVAVDLSGVVGVDPDLVVRPFGWKGFIPNLRGFVLAAANAGMGMQGEEFAWRLPPDRQPDGDADGVERELTVGDITAMTVYNAAQETPNGVPLLASLGMVAEPDDAALARIERGGALFDQVGCTSCHRPEMHLENTVYEEPTKRGGGHYLDAFLASKDPDYDPERPFRFDMLTDAQAPRVEAHPDGGAVVRLYGDLKRHNMGRQLADQAGPQVVFDSTLAPLQIDGEVQFVPPNQFLTAELWGVGSTPLYLHDDRAGTLQEAILLHGEDTPPPPGDPARSEAQEARDAYAALSGDDQLAVITFLKSLVNFSPDR